MIRRIGMTVLLAAVGAMLASCASFEPNPLLGRWTMASPLAPGLVLGTYEFRRSTMTAFGVTQDVEYSVEGNNVLVIPDGIGIGIEGDDPKTETLAAGRHRPADAAETDQADRAPREPAAFKRQKQQPRPCQVCEDRRRR